MPRTPFLILSAYCFAKSLERFYNWLITNRYLGSYIKNYRENRAISLRAKILNVSLLWIVIGYTAIFIIGIIYLKVLLFAIASGVTYHLLSLKTLK